MYSSFHDIKKDPWPSLFSRSPLWISFIPLHQYLVQKKINGDYPILLRTANQSHLITLLPHILFNNQKKHPFKRHRPYCRHSYIFVKDILPVNHRKNPFFKSSLVLLERKNLLKFINYFYKKKLRNMKLLE